MSEEIDEIMEEKIIRLKRLSERLDETFTIPGTERKIGIESIIGAIPLVGDLIGGIISTYIMYSGIKICLLYTSDAADDTPWCRSRWSPYH